MYVTYIIADNLMTLENIMLTTFTMGSLLIIVATVLLTTNLMITHWVLDSFTSLGWWIKTPTAILEWLATIATILFMFTTCTSHTATNVVSQYSQYCNFPGVGSGQSLDSSQLKEYSTLRYIALALALIGFIGTSLVIHFVYMKRLEDESTATKARVWTMLVYRYIVIFTAVIAMMLASQCGKEATDAIEMGITQEQPKGVHIHL